MFVDSHCHLDMITDPEGAVERAKSAGVGIILNPSSGRENIVRVREMAKFDIVRTAVGLHPEEAQTPMTESEIEAEIRNMPKCAAIGETGLDYHSLDFDKAAQESNLRAHIHIAAATGLPIILHNRESDDDMIRILESEFRQKKFTAILHCFVGGDSLLDFALETGIYISASGIITFKNAEKLREQFVRVPNDRILIETDSPFLAPLPFRGKPNEPAFVANVATKLAEIRGVKIEEIEKLTTENFARIINT